MGVSSDEYRAALARWASGVTVVTSRDGERIHGMTVSAFSSVSLEPPLVLVCADKASDTHGVISASGCFAVNLLSAAQEDVSRRFALEGNETERFNGVAWSAGETGCPLIAGALAQLDCRVAGAHDAGDHVIYVGKVLAAHSTEGEPLLYYQARYRTLG